MINIKTLYIYDSQSVSMDLETFCICYNLFFIAKYQMKNVNFNEFSAQSSITRGTAVKMTVSVSGSGPLWSFKFMAACGGFQFERSNARDPLLPILLLPKTLCLNSLLKEAHVKK